MSKERMSQPQSDTLDGPCLGKHRQKKNQAGRESWTENMSHHAERDNEAERKEGCDKTTIVDPSLMSEPSPCLSNENLWYNMDHPNRGKCLVFYFSHYSPHLNLNRRNCADVDKNSITRAFESLGFDVEAHHNLKKEQVDLIIKAVSEEDHSGNDCLAVVFMSHGEFDEKTGSQWLFAYDSKILSQDLWKHFAEPANLLAGKPKLFFIQACRGHQTDGGVTFICTPKALPVKTDNIKESYSLPPDLLVMWSSFPGHIAFRSNRNEIKGSVFIFFLSKIFEEKGSKESLATLLLEVTRNVALEYESSFSLPKIHAKKQVPMTESRLLMDLYFSPKTN